jgi:cell division protein FtsB
MNISMFIALAALVLPIVASFGNLRPASATCVQQDMAVKELQIYVNSLEAANKDLEAANKDLEAEAQDMASTIVSLEGTLASR